MMGHSSKLEREVVREAMRKAFELWLVVIPLDFKELKDGDRSADVKILFGKGYHGDPWPFDGRGGILAHATLPTDGRLHFDDSERWMFMQSERSHYGYTDILPVAIHEIGHVLGLSHSRVKRAIMAPFYQAPVDRYGRYVAPRLDTTDIQAIQDLYGGLLGQQSPSNGTLRPPPLQPFK